MGVSAGVRCLVVFLLIAIAGFVRLAGGAELQTIEDCRFVPTEWADGDSFLVATPEGKRLTVRLYGVDCLEKAPYDETDSRRLRSQRRHFGIGTAGGSYETSIQLAKSYAEDAKTFVVEQLTKPFTIHTAFADARGDGKHKRVYAFVRTSDGSDLADLLVEAGLARAFGVCRSTPEHTSRDQYRELLKDLELVAAQAGKGVWASTDWNRLPEERRIEREEEAELKLAVEGAGALEEGAVVNVNTAARDELIRLPGIGETLANRIIEKRPFLKVGDLATVSGIGGLTLKRLLNMLTVD